MATQQGILVVNGKLRDLVFYQRKQKHVVRAAGKPYKLTAESKKSSVDFGRASTGAAYIRRAFEPLVRSYANGDIVNRLNKQMNAIFKQIPPEFKGNKQLLNADLYQLAGFEFNAYTSFDSLWLNTPNYQMDESGILRITLPKRNSELCFKTNKKFSGMLLQLMVFNFDLEGEGYEIIRAKDLIIDLKKPVFSGASVNIPTTQRNKKAIFVALGVNYLDESLSRDRRYYACKIGFAAQLANGRFFRPATLSPMVVPTACPDHNDGVSWELAADS